MQNIDKVQALAQRLPELEIRTSQEYCQQYGKDWLRLYEPNPCAVAFVRSTQECAELVRVARELALPLVPSGGRTGLSGGATALHQELVVSCEKLNQIRDYNEIDEVVTCAAGTITANLQAFAREQGLFFPISLASDGSSQIGGNIATNAGGIRVLRYGLTRQYVAGLTVVTGTGEIVQLGRGLVKNACGYDLRQLFIGSEGTLGFITEAQIKLTRPPSATSVLLLAVNSIDAVMQTFCRYKKRLSLIAFEYFCDLALAKVTEDKQIKAPFEAASPYYVLIEFEHGSESDFELALSLFEESMDVGEVQDGIVSQSEQQANELWFYRESISEVLASYHPYKNDIAVKPSLVPELMQQLNLVIAEHYPLSEVVWFGHIGDGNCHLNILKPQTMSANEFKQNCDKASHLIFAQVQKLGGSISAEHGIGLLKRNYLQYGRTSYEIDCFGDIKRLFDPDNILNPGKLIG